MPETPDRHDSETPDRHDSETPDYDQFASTAAEYGVELTRVPPAAVSETLASLVDEPAVGTPLPWDDASLPTCIETDPTPADVETAATGVTAASLGIAEYGSVLLEQTPDGSEPVSLFPKLHVFVLREADIVPNMTTAFEWFGEHVAADGGSAILATGPSATADMGALVQGAHGPERVRGVIVK
jgi:L-lactate dehydrogenase complex protein LldG